MNCFVILMVFTANANEQLNGYYIWYW